jgi:hypothetical protein
MTLDYLHIPVAILKLADVTIRQKLLLGLRSRFPVVTSRVGSLRSPYRAATRRENGPLRLKMTTAT